MCTCISVQDVSASMLCDKSVSSCGNPSQYMGMNNSSLPNTNMSKCRWVSTYTQLMSASLVLHTLPVDLVLQFVLFWNGSYNIAYTVRISYSWQLLNRDIFHSFILYYVAHFLWMVYSVQSGAFQGKPCSQAFPLSHLLTVGLCTVIITAYTQFKAVLQTYIPWMMRTLKNNTTSRLLDTCCSLYYITHQTCAMHKQSLNCSSLKKIM